MINESSAKARPGPMAEMPQQNAPNYIPGSKNEWGSVTVITAGVLAVVGAISFAVVTLGVAANNRARAQAVADLGSLAGATADLEVAAQIVAINGAILVSATQVGEAVDVSVSVGDSQASARAERSYAPWNPIDTGPGVTDDIETTTISPVAAPTTTRTLIFPTIPPPTTRALIFATIPQTPPPTTRTVPTTQKPKPRR
jgi:Putative Flp pilus-assembly TadE/G-like